MPKHVNFRNMCLGIYGVKEGIKTTFFVCVICLRKQYIWRQALATRTPARAPSQDSYSDTNNLTPFCFSTQSAQFIYEISDYALTRVSA